LGEIFERALPPTPMEWTGERLTTATAGQVEIEHLHRYFLARELCRGADVLDVASGEGYGSALLAQTAKSVIGVELSQAAVDHAARSYQLANLAFKRGDARRIPLADSSVDAVVSFETLEHFLEHQEFLDEVKRVLRPDGRLILSSPERDVYSPLESAANPYHVNELSRVEFEALLRANFPHVALLFQRPIIGSVLVLDDAQHSLPFITFEKRGPRHYEATAGLPRPPYVVAVASKDRASVIPSSLFIETSEVGHTLGRAAMLAETMRQSDAARIALKQQQDAAEVALNLHRDRANTAEAQLLQLGAEAENDRSMIRKLENEAETLRLSLASVTSELSSMSAQRAALRQALRRGVGRSLISAFGQAAESREVLRERLAILERDVSHWQDQYFRLRQRLEKILRYTGIYTASRLVPGPIRKVIRRALVGKLRAH
jgi:SAM-dependent methyltransferase